MPLLRLVAAVDQAELWPFCRWRCTWAGLPFLSWRQENWRTFPWAEGILHNPSAQPPGQGEAGPGAVSGLLGGACSRAQTGACSLVLHTSVPLEHYKQFSTCFIPCTGSSAAPIGRAVELWLSADPAVPCSVAIEAGSLPNLAGFKSDSPWPPCTSPIVWAVCRVPFLSSSQNLSLTCRLQIPWRWAPPQS